MEDLAPFEGVYQIETEQLEDPGCEVPIDAVFPSKDKDHFVLVGVMGGRVPTLALFSCFDVAHCHEAAGWVHDRGVFSYTANFRWREAGDLVGGIASGGVNDGEGVCRGPDYEEYRAARRGERVTFTTHFSILADRPVERGECHADAWQAREDAPESPCRYTRLLDALRVDSL